MVNSNSILLHKMTQQLMSNLGRDSRGIRFQDEALVRLCMNFRIIGGRKFYEIFSCNLKGVVPSRRSIDRKIAKFQIREKEGEVRILDLVDYLRKNDLPLVVSIAEDATAVTGKLEYSSCFNSVVGFGLPLQANGLPNSKDAEVKTLDDFVSIFRNYKAASTIMVIMAQPLSDNKSPFRNCSFGSTNRFTSDDVENRMNSIVLALKKEGIEVLSYAADGDSRELKMMRRISNLGAGSLNSKCFLTYISKPC